MKQDDDPSSDISNLLSQYSKLARQEGAGRRYSDIVKGVRSGTRPLRLTMKVDEAERKQELLAMLKTGEALRARGAISSIKRLLDDDDPDVRMWSARQFGDIDPEAAAAAIHSIFALLSTQDVLLLRRCARESPPSRPTLSDMSDDALVARFEEAAEREGAAQFLDPIEEPEDRETKNRIVDEIADIFRQLKARGLLARLEPLLDSPDLAVRCRAAQGLLRLNNQRAVAALNSVASEGSFEEALAARDMLDNWREGRCVVDGL